MRNSMAIAPTISSGRSWTRPRRRESEGSAVIFMPSRTLILVLIGVGAVLATLSCVDTPQSTILQAAAASGAVLVAVLVIDGYLSLSAWKRAPLTLKRHLPRAFAVGAPVTMGLSLDNGGARRHSGRL